MKGAVIMKKFICAAAAVLIAFSFYACEKEDIKEEPSSTVPSKTEEPSTETVSTSTTKVFPGGEKTSTTRADITTGLCSEPRKGSVEVAFISEADGSVSNGFVLTAEDSSTVNSIVSNYEFTANSYDNINDMMIKINGKQYAYDSNGGILTYSGKTTPLKEQTVKLDSSDLKRMNKILLKYKQATVGIISNKFIVKEVSQTLLTLAKYDEKAGELKEGLYRGDYGKIENAESMNIKVGDIITVYYETPIAETYPYQINITDIICK